MACPRVRVPLTNCSIVSRTWATPNRLNICVFMEGQDGTDSGFDIHTAVAPLGGLGGRAWRPINRVRNARHPLLRQPSGFEVHTGALRGEEGFAPVNTGYFARFPTFPHSGFDLHGIPVLFSPRQKKGKGMGLFGPDGGLCWTLGGEGG